MQNFNMGFSNNKVDVLIHLTQWQYWWWFWFTFLWVLYYLLVARVFRYRTLKFNPRIASTLRPHGKWGDLLTCAIPVTWCINILLNSNFILKMIEWQSESSLFTLRVRAKQWYWIYKLDLRNVSDVFSTPRNVGRNKWQFSTFGDLQTAEDYLHIMQMRAYKSWAKDFWIDLNKKFPKKNKFSIGTSIDTYRSEFLSNAKMTLYGNTLNLNGFYVGSSDLKEYSIAKTSTYSSKNFKLPTLPFNIDNLSRRDTILQNYASNLFSKNGKPFDHSYFIKSNFTELKKTSHHLLINNFFKTNLRAKLLKINNNRMSFDIPYSNLADSKTPKILIKRTLISSIKPLDINKYNYKTYNSRTRTLAAINLDGYNSMYKNITTNLKFFPSFKYEVELKRDFIKPKLSLDAFTSYKSQKRLINLIRIESIRPIYGNLDKINKKNLLLIPTKTTKTNFINKPLYDSYNFNKTLFSSLLTEKNSFGVQLFIKSKKDGVNLIPFTQTGPLKRTLIGTDSVNLLRTSLRTQEHHFLEKAKKDSIFKNKFQYSISKTAAQRFLKVKIFNKNRLTEYTEKKTFQNEVSTRPILGTRLWSVSKVLGLNNFFQSEILEVDRISTVRHPDFDESGDPRTVKRSFGKSLPFRILKCPNSDISFSSNPNNDIELLRFRFNAVNTGAANKPIKPTLYLTFKQKRYNQRTSISPKTTKFFDKTLNSNTTYSGNPFLKDASIIEENYGSPTRQYRMVKKAKSRVDSTKVGNWNRLLRSRRILVLPAHVNITVITNSFDVVHSWHIPGLGLKMDCLPGRATHHTMYIDNVGLYYGQCAEICGRYHHHMPIRVCALPFEHFLVWWHTFGLPKFLFLPEKKKDELKFSVNKYFTRRFSW